MLEDLLRMYAGTSQQHHINQQEAEQRALEQEQYKAYAEKHLKPQERYMAEGAPDAAVQGRQAVPQTPQQQVQELIYGLMSSGNEDLARAGTGMMNNYASNIMKRPADRSPTVYQQHKIDMDKLKLAQRKSEQKAKQQAKQKAKEDQSNAADFIIKRMENILSDHLSKDFKVEGDSNYVVDQLNRVGQGVENTLQGWAGLDSDLKEYDSLVKGSTSIIGRGIMQEKGVLSNQDVIFLQSLYPDVRGVDADSYETQQNKLKNIKSLIELSKKGELTRESLYRIGGNMTAPPIKKEDIIKFDEFADEFGDFSDQGLNNAGESNQPDEEDFIIINGQKYYR